MSNAQTSTCNRWKTDWSFAGQRSRSLWKQVKNSYDTNLRLNWLNWWLNWLKWKDNLYICDVMMLCEHCFNLKPLLVRSNSSLPEHLPFYFLFLCGIVSAGFRSCSAPQSLIWLILWLVSHSSAQIISKGRDYPSLWRLLLCHSLPTR